jgi:DDE family transposase
MIARIDPIPCLLESILHQSREGRKGVDWLISGNQLRLWFASFAYVLLCALRRIGLAFTQFARASCGSIRLKLLKVGALVKISVRRIHLAMASACPYQHEFALAYALLRRAGA